MTTEKGTPPGGAATGGAVERHEPQGVQGDKSTTTTTPRKIHRVLAALIHRSFNRFEAERDLHDHVLPSTVAAIERQFRVRVERVNETITGHQGHTTRCVRYWIPADQRDRAQRVLRDAGFRR